MSAKVKNNDLFASTGRKKKRGASLDVRKARAGWWFVMPFILGFLLHLPQAAQCCEPSPVSRTKESDSSLFML